MRQQDQQWCSEPKHIVPQQLNATVPHRPALVCSQIHTHCNRMRSRRPCTPAVCPCAAAAAAKPLSSTHSGHTRPLPPVFVPAASLRAAPVLRWALFPPTPTPTQATRSLPTSAPAFSQYPSAQPRCCRWAPTPRWRCSASCAAPPPAARWCSSTWTPSAAGRTCCPWGPPPGRHTPYCRTAVLMGVWRYHLHIGPSQTRCERS